MLQLNVCAKRFVQHFTGFSLSTRAVGHGLFYADDLMALRALAEAMTRAIHFVLWPKPSHVGQFWLFHAPQFPTGQTVWLHSVEIMLTHYQGFEGSPIKDGRAIAIRAARKLFVARLQWG